MFSKLSSGLRTSTKKFSKYNRNIICILFYNLFISLLDNLELIVSHKEPYRNLFAKTVERTAAVQNL